MLNLIRKEILKNSNQENKDNYERYLKNAVKFHGLKNPELLKIFKTLYSNLKEKDDNYLINLGVELLKSEFFEEKRFGIELLSKKYNKISPKFIDEFYELFDNYIYDWGTCDVSCSKIISKMISLNPEIISTIIKWKDSEKIWAKRGAAVSFVTLAKTGKYNDEIIDICSTIVKDNRRFVQLGNGWVLRNLSLVDLSRVIDFIKRNYDYFSREGLRYAIEKMNPKKRKELMNYKK